MASKPRITVTFEKAEMPLREALDRYAAAEGIDAIEAIKRLCIQGLRVPRIVGTPPPRINPIDNLLEGILPRPMARDEVSAIVDEAQRTQAEEDRLFGQPHHGHEGDELPLLGFPEVDELLSERARERRRTTRAAAKSGVMDNLLDELEDDIAQPVGAVAEPAAGAGESPPQDAVHYDVVVRDTPTVPIAVTEPTTGVEVVITPQRAVSDSDIESIDQQLHAHAAPERPAQAAPQSDLLSALVNAAKIRR